MQSSYLLIAFIACLTYVSSSGSSSSKPSSQRGRSSRFIESATPDEVTHGGDGAYGRPIEDYCIIPADNDILQDPTGYGLFDPVYFQEIPNSLRGQSLVDYYNDFSEANRLYLDQILQLRKQALEQATTLAPDIQQYISENEKGTDFSLFANTDSQFSRYGATLVALGAQNQVMRAIHARANQLGRRFASDKHLVGQGNSSILRAIKQAVMANGQDLNEMANWTRPASLSQIDQLMALFPHQDPNDFIFKAKVKARDIARRLDLAPYED